MELSSFEDVFPDWDVIESMDRPQLTGLIDLTTTLLAVDDELEAGRRSQIVHEIFDRFENAPSPEDVQRLQWNAEEQLATDPVDELEDDLLALAGAFDGDTQRVGVMRLLALLAFMTEPTTEQIEYLRATSEAMELDRKLTEDIARAAWETRQGPVDFRVRNRSGDAHRTDFFWSWGQ